MFKALLKKEFASFKYSLFQDKKTGKTRKGGAATGLAIILVISYLSIMTLFFGMSSQMIPPFVNTEYNFLAFAFMGLLAFLISIFVTGLYAGNALYEAKDNELLLSMPIAPVKLLIVRTVAVYLTSLSTTALVLFPTALSWVIFAKPNVISAILSFINIFVFTLFSTVCSCILGFVVSYINSKVTRKSYMTAGLTVLFLVVYYVFYFNMQKIIASVVENGKDVAVKIKIYGFFFYLFGKGSTGNLIFELGFIAINILFAALLFVVLSKTFLKIATGGKKSASKKQKEKNAGIIEIKRSGIKTALLKRELKRFTASAAYLTNVGLGIVLMVAGAICLLVFKARLQNSFNVISAALPKSFSAHFEEIRNLVFAALVCLISSTVYYTAASVSIEGKNFWIIKTSPLSARDIFDAKINAHLLLCGIPATLLLIVSAFVFKTDIAAVAYQFIMCIGYIVFSAVFGLFINIKIPNLDWTNETVPVKQGMPVLVMFLGGWLLCLVIAVLGIVLKSVISANYYMLDVGIVLIVSARLINSYLTKNGEKLLLNI